MRCSLVLISSATSNSALSMTSATPIGPLRAITLSANACDSRRRRDAGWRVLWRGARGGGAWAGGWGAGLGTRVKSNCSSPQGFCSSQHYYRLEDLGFLPRGEAVAFIAERNTALGGKLPLNTNGGGLS